MVFNPSGSEVAAALVMELAGGHEGLLAEVISSSGAPDEVPGADEAADWSSSEHGTEYGTEFTGVHDVAEEVEMHVETGAAGVGAAFDHLSGAGLRTFLC